MKVFMLGWEFPLYINSGLGTACYGLTKAMDELGAEVTFVPPKASTGSKSADKLFPNELYAFCLCLLCSQVHIFIVRRLLCIIRQFKPVADLKGIYD